MTCLLYPVWTCCFKTTLLFSIACTAVLHERQCTTSGLPNESRHKFRALKMNLARGQARLCCCDFIFYAQRHTPTSINRPRARSSYIDFFPLIIKESSCYISSRKCSRLIPSCLIVPPIFWLNGTTTMSSLDIRRHIALY